MHRNFIYSSNKEKTLSNRVLSDTRVSMVLTPGSQIDCLYSGEKSKQYYLISFRADQFISVPFLVKWEFNSDRRT